MQKKRSDIPLVRVNGKNQITLPHEVCHRLGVRPGALIEFEETEQGFFLSLRTLVEGPSPTFFEEEMVIEPEAIRVFLVDDNEVYRRGLRGALGMTSGIEIVGEAKNGEEAIALAANIQPDVILMDLSMSGHLNGIEATRQIKRDYPAIRVLILTVYEEDEHVFNAMCVGASGYLLKESTADEVVQAIRSVNKGGIIFGQAMAAQTLKYFEKLRIAAPQNAHLFPELSARESEILGLLVQGHTTAQIASLLSLTPKTVRNYISHIYKELEVASRVEAIERARQAGLGKKTLE